MKIITKSNMQNKNKNKHEILLGLTTTPRSDWRGKVKEMKKFGIKRIALFPTFLDIKERKELYALLDEIKGLKIPHVHLRAQDTEDWEMAWYEKHGAKVYNIHTGKHVNTLAVLKPYKEKIFIENHPGKAIAEAELKKSAGICLDFQHWARAKQGHPSVAEKTEYYANNYAIGCCHLSPLPKGKNLLWRLIKMVGGHYRISLDELDYIGQYQQYLPEYISLEQENSFKEQLAAKKYLEEKILRL
jgi:hypothetical protein